MNYSKLYDDIIKNRQRCPLKNGYTEKHHINPKCLGGKDTKDNLVLLTAREHFICHYLLIKIYPPKSRTWYKMIHAFMMMNAMGDKPRYYNSRLYEANRTHFAEVMSVQQRAEHNSQHGTRWIYNLDLEQCKKISKTENIPKGWKVGRVMDFKEKKQRELAKAQSRTDAKFKREQKVHLKRLRYEQLFEMFKSGSYNSITEFVKETNFEFSRQILIKNWQTFLNLPSLQWGKQFTSNDANSLSVSLDKQNG